MNQKSKTFLVMKRTKKYFKVTFYTLFAVLFISSAVVNAQDGAAIFKQNCGSCHKVGGGRMVGPDLIGVTTKRSPEWLKNWVRGSQAFIKSGDKDAKAIYDEFGTAMPDQTTEMVSDADLKAIFAFITSKSTVVANDTSKKSAPAIDSSNFASASVIDMGKNIFLGSYALSNGGPACISCHNVNYAGIIPGGLLAKDLTTVHSRLGGDMGIQGILGAPPFPAMTQAYKDKPITNKEIAAVIAFLNKVDKDKPNQIVSEMNPLLYGGTAGMCVLLVLIFMVWYTRKKTSVKKDIYNRQIKSI